MIAANTQEPAGPPAARPYASNDLKANEPATRPPEGSELNDLLFRTLVQGVEDYAIFMLDASGNILTWNAGAQRINGYAPEEIIGRHYSALHADEDRHDGLPESALEIARRDGRFSAVEATRIRRDGTRFYADVLIDAIHDDDGQIIGFTKITKDVTERVRSRQELEDARQKLFQSQKMEALGQLTGEIAHDFNNLLAAISVSLEGALRAPLDARTRQLIENAQMAAGRGRELTTRMLAFARQQDLDVRPVSLAQLIQGLGDLLTASAGKLVTLQTLVPDDIDPVSADPYQLELALLNLVVNARDAMPEGGTVRITAESQAVRFGPGIRRYVRLTVTDTGCGMDPMTLEKARLPFFTTKPPGQGTGLGLATVHGLAEQLGGWLELKSHVGIGTSAAIVLPVAAAGVGMQSPE